MQLAKKTLSADPLTTPPKKTFSRNFIFLDNKVFISFIKNNLLATAGLPISPLVSSSSQKPFFWIKVALIPKFYLKNQWQESFFRKKHWLKKYPPLSSTGQGASRKSRLDIFGPIYHLFYLRPWSFLCFPFFRCFSGEFCLPQFDPEFFGYTGIPD